MFDFYMERGVFPEVNTSCGRLVSRGSPGSQQRKRGSSKGSVEEEPNGCAPACPLEKLIPIDYKGSLRR